MHIGGELQTSQNEPAAGNFATFSGIFAAYSTVTATFHVNMFSV